VPVFGVKNCPRYTVSYRWTGPGLTSILAGGRQGTNGLSNVTAKESISIVKVHVILLLQNEDRVRMFVHFFFFWVVLRSKRGQGLLILRFLDHTQRRTTLGRTSLDEWSARPRKLYLAIHLTTLVLTFFTTFVSNIFHLRRNEWDMIENVYWSSCKALSCPVLMKLELSRQIFEKILKNQISWKSVLWEPSCSMRTDGRTDGWTDGQTDMAKLIVAFRERAYKRDSQKIRVHEV